MERAFERPITPDSEAWTKEHLSSGAATQSFEIQNMLLDSLEIRTGRPDVTVKGLEHFKEVALRMSPPLTDEEQAHLFARAERVFANLEKA